MPEMVVTLSEIRVRLDEEDFCRLVSGEEVVLHGDYNIIRGGRRTLRLMLSDIGLDRMLNAMSLAARKISPPE